MRLIVIFKLAMILVFAVAIQNAAAESSCPGNKNALGVSRTVQIDTTGGPGFGFEHYKFYDFLKKGEVVLTFDDGPLPSHTVKVLDALAAHCTKATFFPVGKIAVGYPEVLRRVYEEGHTIANHTWSHFDLSKKKEGVALDEIEKGASAVRVALGKPGAPFFRFPYLKDTPETITYLGKRNFAVFSTDIDSFDFRRSKPKVLISRVMNSLKKKGKGILLFHDANPFTARAMPEFLNRLQAEGYKIVHLTAKATAETIPEYDEKVAKIMNKGRPNMGLRPMTSVISTVSEDEPAKSSGDAANPSDKTESPTDDKPTGSLTKKAE